MSYLSLPLKAINTFIDLMFFINKKKISYYIFSFILSFFYRFHAYRVHKLRELDILDNQGAEKLERNHKNYGP